MVVSIQDCKLRTSGDCFRHLPEQVSTAGSLLANWLVQ